MTEKNLYPNLKVFQRLFDLDERTIDAIKGDILKRGSNKSCFLGRLSITPWFVRAVSIFERLIAPSMSKTFDPSEDDFVFVSCIDPIHRVKTLPLMVKDFKYTLFFLPTVTRPTVVKAYYKHYMGNSQERVCFGTFNRGDVTKYKKFIKQKAAFINEIQCDNENDTRVLREYVHRFALYRIYAERVFGSVKNDKLWLFEHDKFFFIPVINYFRQKGIITTQLQHGTFINSEKTTLFPLYSDNIICCSEREAQMYEGSGVQKSNIFVLGSPLQTLVASHHVNQNPVCDLLVLLTITNDPYKELQKEALSEIRKLCGDKLVRLRFRPRSIKMDKANLSGSIDGYEVSNNVSLTEDVSTAKYVISFSFDAVFEVIRLQKPFMIITAEREDVNKQFAGLCCNLDGLSSGYAELIKKPTPYLDPKAIQVFGEVDPETLCAKFENFINNGLKHTLPSQ